MKISKINIDSFHQFKNLKLDLTYPVGHAKGGQPLDKVCFIGQSGTGKTSILNVIKAFMDKSYRSNGAFPHTTYMEKVFGKQAIGISAKKVNGEDKMNTHYAPLNEQEWRKQYNQHYQNSLLFLSFSAEILDKMNEIFKKKEITKLNDIFIPEEEWEGVLASEREDFNNRKFFDFGGYDSANNGQVWRYILNSIYEYRAKAISYPLRIGDATYKKQTQLAEEIQEEYKKWLDITPNPLQIIANQIDGILSKFNLKVKTELDFNEFNKIEFIQLQTIQKKQTISFNNWSTGTKQLLLTSLPLIAFSEKCRHALILFDEPERSFYPDIQQDIMDFYTKIVPESQFFVATHSPIIAAQFEPWEIVELKFDQEGNVFQELYYDSQKERHVDNYEIYPQYLPIGSVFSKVFDVPIVNPQHQEKMAELAELGVKLRNLKEDSNVSKAEKKSIWDKYVSLAEKLDWDYHTL